MSARLTLRARNSVAVTLRPGPGGVTDGLMLATSNFGFVPSLGDDAASGEKVNVRKIDDNTWEIDLPPWFKVAKPGLKSGASK